MAKKEEDEMAKERQRVWDSLPKGRVYQAPTDLDHLFDGVKYEISPKWGGERIRKGEYALELGGPRFNYTSVWFIEIVHDPDRIQDGRIELIGPDIPEIPDGTSLPFMFWIRYYGKELDDLHLDLLTRWTYMALEFGEGWMLLNTRDTIWLRLRKTAKHKHDFFHLAQAMIANTKIMFPYVEKGDAKLIIGVEELGGLEKLREIINNVCIPYWERMDAMASEFSDEDVDTFYGCAVCQTFAPNHVCVVAPDRPPYCGIITWIGAKVMYELDPYGYTFIMPKGECLDPIGGEYTGVNEVVYQKSNRSYKRVVMYSTLLYPQTNCGCFEAGIFYIPEVDGLGMVDRRYTGITPLGITFSKLAGFMSGGMQNHGYCGMSFRTPRSRKFMLGDGGWYRIVWMPKEYKQMLAEYIPEEIYDKIATEEDAIDPKDLKEFLKKVGHPVTKLWKNGEEPEPLKLPPPNGEWDPEEEKRAKEKARILLEMQGKLPKSE
ncbi:MAG: CO dehydrogenase/acetyl-CoA synthase beta subunit [Candidatus Alkanophagales archaeon MCA70_species_1]|nr:CO dehydrogenase/acetyl-CoA synthase beta subunit [Candidatus Alkanophaga volatiphilum]